MIGISNLQCALLASTEAAAWLNQVYRIKCAATIIALVAACLRISTMRAGSLNIAVRQKTPIRRTIGRLHRILEDIPFIVEREKEILRNAVMVFSSRLGI